MSFLGSSRAYAFGAVSESEVTKFVKKVADGKKATTDFETAAALINRLPGWNAAPAVVAFPADGYRVERFLSRNYRARISFWGAITSKEAATISSHSYAEFFALVDRGVIEVFTPEAAAAPREGIVYVENLFDRDSIAQAEKVGRLYIGVSGLIVTAPSVASAKVANPVGIGSDPSDPGVFGLGSFWTWAKSTNFAETVKALASATIQPPTEREEALVRIGTLDHTGICPICGRYQKFHGITKGRLAMYDHGYQIARGWWRQGSCLGVGFPPFEVSPAGSEFYLSKLTIWIAQSEKKLADTRSGTVVLTNPEHKTDERGRLMYEGRMGQRKAVYHLVEYAPGSVGYGEIQRKQIAELVEDIAGMKEQQQRWSEKVRNWKREPTYDEEKAGRLLY